MTQPTRCLPRATLNLQPSGPVEVRYEAILLARFLVSAAAYRAAGGQLAIHRHPNR